MKSPTFYLKNNVKIKDNFINYVHTKKHDVKSDLAASERWKNSLRLEKDKAFAEHQFDDFLLRYGFRSGDDLGNYLSYAETIAEIGAGEGRAVDWYLKYSKAHVFALEISDSVYYLQEKYRDNPRVTVIKADALHHPFKKRSIDFLSCEQSLSNTIDPQKIFFSLAESLNERSKVILSVVARKSNVREKMDLIIRDSIARLREKDKQNAVRKITEIGKLLSEININVKVPGDCSELGTLSGKEMSLQRFIYYAVFKCFYNKEFLFDKSMEFNYDWYCYEKCNKFTLDELCIWYIKNGIRIEYVDVNDSNINLRGGK